MDSREMLKTLVLVDHVVGISGPHRNVVGSLNALAARNDIQVRLLCGRFDENEPYSKMNKVDIRSGFNPHAPSKVITNLLNLQSAARDCDVIYVPTGLKSFLYAQVVRRGRKLVAGPNVTHLPIRKTDSPGKIELGFMCDLWFEASEIRRDHVKKQSGVETVRFVHHAIDGEKFSPEHRSMDIWDEYKIPKETIKVLYVGHDNVNKGVRFLLEAIEIIEIVARKCPNNNIQFVFVGKMTGETQKQISKFKNAHALGFKQGLELPRIFASSDISVVPSYWENMPFVVLEAMASGLPVIASRTGGIPEQIVSNESGLLVNIVDNQDHNANTGDILAQAILKLAKAPSLRHYLGTNARNRIVEHFSEPRLGQELSELFYEVTGLSNE